MFYNEEQKLSYKDLLNLYHSLRATGLVQVHLSHVGFSGIGYELVAWAHTRQGYHSVFISSIRNASGEMIDPAKLKEYHKAQMAE